MVSGESVPDSVQDKGIMVKECGAAKMLCSRETEQGNSSKEEGDMGQGQTLKNSLGHTQK